MKEKIIGIDLGTTNSCVSIVENGEPVVILSSEGGRTVPSVVSWKKTGERIVGVTAKRASIVNPENTISSVKRFMGHTYEEIKDESKKVSYKVKANDKKLTVIDIPAINKTLTPEEVSASILSKLKQDAEAYLGHEVKKAVITVPAYFNDSQRLSTKNAGEIAGLDVVRIINEPTAAALAYGKNKDKTGNILIFDLGGGTFDVTVLDVNGGDVFEVLSTAGDSHLGGDDFDNKIVDWVVLENKKKTGIDLSKDPSALQRIKEAAEKAKIELSSQVTTMINLPYITSQDNNPVHLELELTRSNFENLVKDLLVRIRVPIEDALKNSGINKEQLKEVILVGGSSRMPCAQNIIKEMIGLEPSKGVNPDEAVALGAAIQGGIIAGDVEGLVLLDVTPLSLGVEVNGGMVDILIPKNTTIPTKKQSIYTTAVANQTSVQIHILQGERTLSKDNKSLGMFSLEGIMPAPAHVPQIEVSFDLNVDGILSVSAKDLGTNKEQTITITQSSNLSKDEIERMIKEAEEYAESDREAKDFIMLKHEAETLCNSIETTLEEAKDKIDQKLIDDTKEALIKTRDALSKGEKEEITATKTILLGLSHNISAKLYESVQPEQPQVENPFENMQS